MEFRVGRLVIRPAFAINEWVRVAIWKSYFDLPAVHFNAFHLCFIVLHFTVQLNIIKKDRYEAYINHSK